ncbi:MAG: ABC-F family ATP-binding cassette domain-containing protein [Planctomycetota bacterium]
MSLLRLTGATKGFNDRTLFEGVDFELGEGERVGLVGRNGCGKSSLLRILAGVDPPDEGERTLRRGVRVGYLEQEPALDPDATAREVVRAGIEGRADTLAALAAVHASLESAEGARMQELLAELERLEAELAERGGHDVEHRIEATLDALDVADPDARTGPMSGGERRRVALARLLVSRPDVLLLDEPTNHLDAFVTDWLEDWFLETRQPLVLVTHDRYLLERVVDRIVEVDAKKLHGYAGGYSDYIEARALRIAAEERAEQGRLALLRRETAWIRRGPPARTTKSKARIKAYDDLVDAAPDVAPEDLELRIPPGPRLGARVVNLEGISKAFGARTLVSKLDLEITADMRLGIVGPNGAGKSTLMRIVSGELEPDAGTRAVGETVRFMGIDQGRSDLDLEGSVAQNVAGRQDIVRVGSTEVRVESFLAKFGFDERMRTNLVRTLSGGERARVMLAKLLLEGGNVALLDEPTNDLDLSTLRGLEEALLAWPGAALVVTHDRWFLDRVATHVLYLDGRGGARLHHGDVSALLKGIREEREEERLAEQRARRQAAARSAEEKEAARADAAEPAKKRRLTPWEEKELAELEGAIAADEERLAALDAQLASPDLWGPGADPAEPRRLQTEREAAQAELDRRYERWTELADA